MGFEVSGLRYWGGLDLDGFHKFVRKGGKGRRLEEFFTSLWQKSCVYFRARLQELSIYIYIYIYIYLFMYLFIYLFIYLYLGVRL